MRVRYAYGIYDADGVLQFVNLGMDPKTAWAIFLGWPSDDEVEAKVSAGYKCVKVAIAPL